MGKVAIVVFAGSNRHNDMKKAIQYVGGEPVMVWYQDKKLPNVQAVVLPGGFSFGDYLRPGAIAARSPIIKDVVNFANSGKPVVGVCNGFQILTEIGLLPGILLKNKNMAFRGGLIKLEVCQNKSIYSNLYQPGKTVTLAVAHGSGSYYCDRETLDKIQDNGQVILRYYDDASSEHTNFNGSVSKIAGVCNAKGNVVGIMPHPENVVNPQGIGGDGYDIIAGLIRENN